MKIAVLVSGGVDSSLSLKLLKEQGHDLVAFYIKVWLEDELVSSSCPWEEDLKFIKPLCQSLNVPLEVISLQQEYKEKVISYVIEEAKAGRTPNPDILCNQQIKFGLFLEKIGAEFEKVASGHYAQIREENGVFKLFRAADPVKDQTYFLCKLSQKQLSRVIFPIGHLQKGEVRDLAKKYALPAMERRDSQGICFLGNIKFDEFIAHHLGKNPGDIVELESNKKIGTHDGLWFFTVGQRRRIKLSGGPWYVVKKEFEKNILYVSNRYGEIEGERKSFVVADLHWLSGKPPESGELLVKVRHRSVPRECVLSSAHVTLFAKDQGIAPGQYAVFYLNDECLGSGVIQ